MEHKKITSLLGKTTLELPRFVTEQWVEIFDRSDGSYNLNKDIRFKTSQLRSDLCDFNDAYIVVTGKITATNPGNCILKINNQLIENAQDLDVAMSMYNLLHYSKNFRKATGSFWNYHPDIPSSGYNKNNRDRIFHSIKNSESLNYKTKTNW